MNGGDLDATAEQMPLILTKAASQSAAVCRTVLGRDEQRGELAAENVVGAVAEDPLGGGVELPDPSHGVDRDDAVQRGVDDGAMPRESTLELVEAVPVLDRLRGQRSDGAQHVEQLIVGAQSAVGLVDRDDPVVPA